MLHSSCIKFEIRREFRALLRLDEGAGTLKQLWPEWAEKKLLAMGRMESANQPGVKRRLQDLDKDEHLDCKDGVLSLHFSILIILSVLT